MGEGLPLIKSVKISNPKIVSNWDVLKDGSIYVYGKKKGKTKVYLKLNNGKKYTINVTVKPGDPDLYAQLYSYNTRENYFVVRVKNNGDKTITILRNDAKVEDNDYKSYDRNLKSAESIKLAPGKSKMIRFYVRGSNTWPDYEDFTLLAKIKYEGVTYEWHVWHDDSVYKHDKKWYTTYWNEDNYSAWCY